MDANEPPVAAVLVGFILVSACNKGMHVCGTCLETALEVAAVEVLSIRPPEGSSLEVIYRFWIQSNLMMRSRDLQPNLCDLPDTQSSHLCRLLSACLHYGQSKEEQRTSGS